MKTRYFVIVTFLLTATISCNEDPKETTVDPSTIEFEIQTYGDLTAEGTVFGSKQTLVRENIGWVADGEQNVLGTLDTLSSDSTEILTIYGWGSGTDSPVEQIWFRIPAIEEGSYTFDPNISTDDHFWLELKTTYNVVFEGGNHNAWMIPKTDLTVVINEITEERIKGSFTGSLLYFDVDSTNKRTLNEEISNVNKPIINGSFDVFRF